MKKLLIVIALLAMAVGLNAATLKWDASAGDVDGYNIQFTDGTENFNYNAGAALEVLNIDKTLNLHRGKTYVFTATAYNQMGESARSNSVDYTTAPAYVAPENSIPIKQGEPTTIILTLTLE